MKLKPVVASLIMFGLMTPSFAVSGKALSQQAVIDQNSVITPLCAEGWFNRIQLGGVGSIVGAVGNHDPAGYFTPVNNSSDLYINNFNLLLNADLSTWSKATVNLAYFGAPNPWGNLANTDGYYNGAANVASVLNRKINHQIAVDEVYVTLGNMAKYPFYVVVGKKYVPFGDYYDPSMPLQIMSPAQMLAQTNGVTAIAGVASDFGLYASLFGLRGETRPKGSTAGNIRNFGGKIGYYTHLGDFQAPNVTFNAAISYINNLWDSQVFSPNANPQWVWFEASNNNGNAFKINHPATDSTGGINTYGYYIDSVNGLSAHVDLAYQSFSISANWVGALKKMVENAYSVQADSSKFWGADVNADYSFKTLDRNSSLSAFVHFSGNGKWMGDIVGGGATDWARIIPKWRLGGEYRVNIFKNTDLDLVVAHGKSYDFVGEHRNGDANISATDSRNTTVGLARLIIQL